MRPGQSLRDTVHRWTAEGRPVPLELVRGLAVEVARLHRAGCVHGDLYLDHWLREDTAEGPRWVLIDLARVGEPRWTFARRRIKDLAAVEYSARTAGVPRTVRLRAFRWYLGGLRSLSFRGLDRDALRRLRRARRLWRAVLRRADWIEARERRHGRWPVPLPGVESCTSA